MKSISYGLVFVLALVSIVAAGWLFSGRTLAGNSACCLKAHACCCGEVCAKPDACCCKDLNCKEACLKSCDKNCKEGCCKK